VLGCDPIEDPDFSDNKLGDGDPGGTGVLLEDAFDGPSLSSTWLQSPANSTIEIDAAGGDPEPSLHIHTDPSSPGGSSAFVTTTTGYNNADGLTIRVGVRVDNPGRSGINTDGVQVVLLDQGRLGFTRALMGIHRNLQGGVTVVYNIDPGTFPAVTAQEDIAMPTGYHEFTLMIDEDGSARWARDGNIKLMTALDMIEADIQVMLLVTGVGTSTSPEQAAAHFDNLRITRP